MFWEILGVTHGRIKSTNTDVVVCLMDTMFWGILGVLDGRIKSKSTGVVPRVMGNRFWGVLCVLDERIKSKNTSTSTSIFRGSKAKIIVNIFPFLQDRIEFQLGCRHCLGIFCRIDLSFNWADVSVFVFNFVVIGAVVSISFTVIVSILIPPTAELFVFRKVFSCFFMVVVLSEISFVAKIFVSGTIAGVGAGVIAVM